MKTPVQLLMEYQAKLIYEDCVKNKELINEYRKAIKLLLNNLVTNKKQLYDKQSNITR